MASRSIAGCSQRLSVTSWNIAGCSQRLSVTSWNIAGCSGVSSADADEVRAKGGGRGAVSPRRRRVAQPTKRRL
jgi:hypothetical protein